MAKKKINMQELFQAMVQLGVAPVVTGYLLWDYSKKLTAIQVEMVKVSERLDHITGLLEKKK